jgi:hypothetical protein
MKIPTGKLTRELSGRPRLERVAFTPRWQRGRSTAAGSSDAPLWAAELPGSAAPP